MLEQPFRKAFLRARSVLLAGCGGGYDVLGAVPLLADLAASGIDVHLASVSFSFLDGLHGAARAEIPNLYEVPSSAATNRAYCPEAWLARWLETRLGRPQPIWCFDKTGVAPLLNAYRHLVERLGIDTIVLVDGGIDSLLRGDESSLGTPSEDLASLAAVWQLEVPVKMLGCLGFGAEIREGIPHSQVLERIADLTRRGSFLGVSSVVDGSDAGKLYRDAVEFVFANQTGQRTSHVHSVVLEAAAGRWGHRGSAIWISPLLPLFWFFDLDAVAESHLFLRNLLDTESIWDVSARIEAFRKEIVIRDPDNIPI